jgi:hypothetical protein
MFPARDHLAIALIQPHLRPPADVLEGFGQLFQTQLEMTADFGRVAIGPPALDECSSGMAIARLGDAPLTAPLPRRVFRRGEAEIAHELLGVVEPGQVPEFGHGRDGYRELNTPQGLERLDYGRHAP